MERCAPAREGRSRLFLAFFSAIPLEPIFPKNIIWKDMISDDKEDIKKFQRGALETSLRRAF
jgi:hypothetical protein